jgi:hypothetical protein
VKAGKGYRLVACTLLTALIATCLASAPAPAPAAPGDPIFYFYPHPPPPPPPKPLPPPPRRNPPPTEYLNGPCGLAISSSGNFYISDHQHRAIDVFDPIKFELLESRSQPLVAHTPFGAHEGPLDDPCGIAFDSSGALYLNNYHRSVARFPAPLSLASASVIDPGPATGMAVDPTTDEVFVNRRDVINAYDSSGSPATPAQIGLGSLGEGYGLAVSGYSATADYLYVADASDQTVKVYDPASDAEDPIAVINGPPGGFTSLRDSALAVDDTSGEIYVVDLLQPADTETPEARIQVFDSTGAYEGHLKFNVIDGAPTGIAIDNTASPRHPDGTQGRVYVTSGNTHRGGIYIYPPDAAVGGTSTPPLVPPFPPLGGGELFPTVQIGGAAHGPLTDCEGDSCQVLPPEPTDPTLTTLLSGRGNPEVHYRSYARSCASLVRAARKLSRRAARAKGAAERNLERLAKRARRLAKRCRAANRGTARASSSLRAGASSGFSAIAQEDGTGSTRTAEKPRTRALLSGGAGFAVAVVADGGQAATVAGTHPYRMDLSIGLDQSGGVEDLRSLRIELPPGLLVNPANAFGTLCVDDAFATPRATQFPMDSQSGESCPDLSQIGTVEATEPGGSELRCFGIFNLQPKAGTVARFGAAPFGHHLAFDVYIRSDVPGAYTVLDASEVPEALALQNLRLSFWGAPWDSTHNVERGDCLNETEPAFAWAKCSAGDPINTQPRAFLTLPTLCGSPLEFKASIGSWQDPALENAVATNRDSGGAPAPLEDCGAFNFALEQDALLSVKKASSASGFVFRFDNNDLGLTEPRTRVNSLVKKLTVELPRGVTLNPSLGAGMGVCTAAQVAAESVLTPPGAGCPNASKIGSFILGLPYFSERLRGSVYLAQPDDPATSAHGAENPFDSLLAVYLIAKSADRDLFFRIPGKLSPDPGDGTLTATFDDLPQLPYSDFEVNFRSGQRAPLISPPHCGPATTKIAITPWTPEAPADVSTSDSPIETGVEAGPCPTGTPPFSPEALTGGVNSNVGSYTPYYVRLSRKDTEQEITSYSLVLPKGITGKLAGVPFCPEGAIEAARHKRGATETASPSCPAASQVGRTDTGYGVGKALTYAPGRIYLAGPYHGAPLSLVTINSATVGPFDLGTIVIRSAFQVDQHTAQLQIDSSASDPIPHIIDGVPLHLREVRIYMDRFQFTHNPSSCEPSQLTSRLTGSGATFSNPADDSVANVAKHFQLLNCLTLGFKPKLGLRLRGSARRGGFPSLRATFASRGAKDSNLKKIEVEMPHSLFLAQNHIRTVCTQPLFQAERCPAGSVYGKAVAKTLLFDEPLRGNVYLRASDSKLPDLVADLHSGVVRIVVEGRIGPGKHGGILTFFDELPDAPIDSFRMTLGGGKHGLLQNSVNICSNPPLATVSALGQNNIGARFSSILRGQCGGKGEKKG